ncbi:MAG: hypothetical protein PHW63_10245 [Alphaproteobacteria bacterium]|nr:hypothetical protein [Alphaproteobacteria bacterium]
MRNFQMSLYALMLVIASLFMFGCGDNEPLDSRGADVPQGQCTIAGATPGAICQAGEGSECGSTNTLVCHCGYWTVRGSAQAGQACQNNIPAETCVPSRSCASGATCTGSNGALKCVCGMWATPDMESKLSCNNQSPNPGTGGSGGSYNPGTGGSSGTPSGTSTAVGIKVYGSATHIWCEGALVEKGNYSSDSVVKFYEPWHSFGCDSFSGSYSCTVNVPNTASLRFQCYLNTAGSSTSGDLVRYTCAYDWQLLPGEVFETTRNGQIVTPALADNLAPKNAANCQLEPL